MEFDVFCKSEKPDEWTIEFPVIWDVMVLMWHHCNVVIEWGLGCYPENLQYILWQSSSMTVSLFQRIYFLRGICVSCWDVYLDIGVYSERSQEVLWQRDKLLVCELYVFAQLHSVWHQNYLVKYVIDDMANLSSQGSANERRRYIVTSSLIGWAHTQNDHSVYGFSQWETTSHCNVVSHWLSPYTELSLSFCFRLFRRYL